ncbi:MAG: pyruvate kinase [Microbacteriaceae bacterium]
MRRAKIVATIGPATESLEQLKALIAAGMNVARLNLSHGSYDVHEAVYKNLREAEAGSGKPVAVLVDLQGPKIRIGRFADGPHTLIEGETFQITTNVVPGDGQIVSTTFLGLPANVNVGDPLLLDDGKLKLICTANDGTTVTTRVEIGGPISNNKGINLPGVAVDVPALSEKDEADLRWALKLGADYIALSFVRSAEDIVRVHEIMSEEGRSIPAIAKIEKPQAVDNLDEILEAFDGIMVARGDLGVELPLEAVPIVQKEAVDKARRLAKPVIVATQMMESMLVEARPTRAEASDCANAVLDGADALMLSGETSVGAHPIEAVSIMAKIIESTEEHGLERIPPLGTRPRTQGGALTLASVGIAEFIDAKAYCVFSESGDSVRRMSRLRDRLPIYAFTPNMSTRRRLCLTWGVKSFEVARVNHTDQMFLQVDDILLDDSLDTNSVRHYVNEGDKVIVIAGTPPGISGSTNDIRVHRMGDTHNESAPAYLRQ